MSFENQHPLNKNLMVSVLGVPNAGKSSMINYLLGMDLSAVTPKPQTTRNKFHCVLTIDRTEIILVDTPGLHSSGREINRRFNQQAREALRGVNLNLLLLDLSRPIFPQLQTITSTLEEEQEWPPTWPIFTKADLAGEINPSLLQDIMEKAKELIPSIEKNFVISSQEGLNMHLLTGALCDAAPFGPHLYPDGSISNKNERFFVTEYIREQAFELLKGEIPHEMAVVIEEYQDFPKDHDKGAYISASLLVNRPGQKVIAVGSKGRMIKEIGTRGRKKIETLLGKKVYLNLHVKVFPRWFKNHFILEQLGLPRAKDSTRVWRRPTVQESATE